MKINYSQLINVGAKTRYIRKGVDQPKRNGIHDEAELPPKFP